MTRGGLWRVLPVSVFVLGFSTVVWVRVPLLPAMGAELSMRPTTLGLLVTAFGVGRLLIDLPAGRLAGRFSHGPLLTVSGLGLFVASTMLALAPSPPWVFAAITVMGAASAVSNTTGMTAHSASVGRDLRGRALALYSGALLSGQAIGPMVGGLIASSASWRAAFGTAAMVSLAMALTSLAITTRGRRSRFSKVTQSEVGENGTRLGLTATVALLSISFSMFYAIGAGTQTLVPLIGDEQFGLGPAAIGLALGAAGGARLVSVVVSGFVSDRCSRRAALFPSLVLQAIGATLLALGDAVHWWLLAVVVIALGSAGYGVGAAIIGDSVSAKRLGLLLGRYRFAGDLGLVIGPVLTGVLYERVGADMAAGFSAGVLSAAMVLVAVIPETNPRRPS